MKDEYFLQNPSRQKFYENLAYFMELLALNAQYWYWFKLTTNKLYRLQRILVIIFLPVATTSQLIYMYFHYKQLGFAEHAMMFSVVPFALIITLKFLAAHMPAYKKVIKSFMDTIHLHIYYIKDNDKDRRNFIKQNLISAEKNTRYTLQLIMTLVLICFFSWMIFPIIHNVQNNPTMFSNNITQRLEICIYFWMPFDYEFNLYGYLLVQVLGVYCGGIGVVILVLFDTVNFALIYHLMGHIKIIKFDLKTKFSEGMDDDDAKQRLKNIMDYYYFITKTFKDVEAAYGLNVAGIYAQNLFQGGLILYQLSAADINTEAILTLGLIVPIVLGVMILMSLVLENIRIEADDIPTLVYYLPWQKMSIENQKYVLALLVQVQPTLEFRAAFNIKTGIQPAISIIKTAFSYYVMIKSRVEIN